MTRFQGSARERRRMLRLEEEDWRPKTLRGWLALVGGYLLLIPILALVFAGGFTLFGGWALVGRAPTWVRWAAYTSAAVVVDHWRRVRRLPDKRWIMRTKR